MNFGPIIPLKCKINYMNTYLLNGIKYRFNSVKYASIKYSQYW